MQPVSASRKSSSQVFSAFNIAIMNVYMFLASDRSSHAAASCRQNYPISGHSNRTREGPLSGASLLLTSQAEFRGLQAVYSPLSRLTRSTVEGFEGAAYHEGWIRLLTER